MSRGVAAFVLASALFALACGTCILFLRRFALCSFALASGHRQLWECFVARSLAVANPLVPSQPLLGLKSTSSPPFPAVVLPLMDGSISSRTLLYAPFLLCPGSGLGLCCKLYFCPLSVHFNAFTATCSHVCLPLLRISTLGLPPTST